MLKATEYFPIRAMPGTRKDLKRFCRKVGKLHYLTTGHHKHISLGSGLQISLNISENVIDRGIQSSDSVCQTTKGGVKVPRLKYKTVSPEGDIKTWISEEPAIAGEAIIEITAQELDSSHPVYDLPPEERFHIAVTFWQAPIVGGKNYAISAPIPRKD